MAASGQSPVLPGGIPLPEDTRWNIASGPALMCSILLHIDLEGYFLNTIFPSFMPEG